MANFWKIVNEVIRRSDIILLVMDSRFPEKTRNKEIEDKVQEAEKTLIFVLNKCDLVDRKTMGQLKNRYFPSVFISATQKLGTTMLRDKILRFSDKEKVFIGVVGYPNTGKSSVINALKGRASAKTSSESGFTKGLQKIKADNRIMLIDSPGVIPYRESDEKKHARIASLNPSKIKDPDLIVFGLLEDYGKEICLYYDVKYNTDFEKLLERITLKLNKLKKGGEPDVNVASRLILKDFQKGKIRFK